LITLDALGLRCTSTAAKELRSVQLKWLRGITMRTGGGMRSGKGGDRPFAGLVLHNIATKRRFFKPTLLDWRKKAGPEGAGETVSLILPWMNKYIVRSESGPAATEHI
jgi:hypothetical protein